MHKYLMIENAGEAPISALTLMGATTKDASSDDSTIGMFGSGTKYSVLALLRRNTYPVITTGKDRLEWQLRPIMIGNVSHNEVMLIVNNRKPASTGTTLKAGETDWKSEVNLALREFLSNAIDQVGKDNVHWQLVDEPRCRAGYTRVFIPWTADGLPTFTNFVDRYFLHWRKGATPAKAGPIVKRSVDGESRRAYFYRRGVLIRTWSTDKPSLWDYNFIDLTLDESRNSNDWDLQYQAAKLLGTDPDRLKQTIVRISEDPTLWESELNSYGLTEALRKAQLTFEPNVVYAANGHQAQSAGKKGLDARVLPDSWIKALDSVEGPTVHRDLGEWTRKGVDLLDTVPDNFTARTWHWQSLIIDAGLAKGEGTPASPKLRAFSQHPGANQKLWGFATPEAIYLNHELGGELLDQTIIEELAHFHSGCCDFTREFQEWLIRFAIRTSSQTEQ